MNLSRSAAWLLAAAVLLAAHQGSCQMPGNASNFTGAAINAMLPGQPIIPVAINASFAAETGEQGDCQQPGPRLLPEPDCLPQSPAERPLDVLPPPSPMVPAISDVQQTGGPAYRWNPC